MTAHNNSSADICDAAVDRAMTSFQQAVNSMVSCKRCNGTGYHHGFGEHGHDPDWCEVCGGCQSVPEFNDREAMCLAIKAALSGAVAQAVSESIPRASHTARQGGWRLDFDWLVGMQDGIEEATGYNITLECLEEAVVRTEAICTAAQPPADPVETERKTFTIPPGYEAVRDSEGRATGEVRPQSSAGTDDLTTADPGTITRNLRGLASRMEYRVEAIEQRDGKGAGAIQGQGIGIGYLLAKDLANALAEAAAYIEKLPLTQPQGVPEQPAKAFELTPLMIKLLKGAWSNGRITLADDMAFRHAEMAAMREMAEHGLVRSAEEDRLMPGPPRPPGWVITDKGREAATTSLSRPHGGGE